MREILFKAKRLDNGEWVEGNLFWQMYDGVTTLCIQTEPINANDYGDIIGDWYMVDPETVCQYTGITDKNGVKIFDGDIVTAKSLFTTYCAFKIKWIHENAKFVMEGYGELCPRTRLELDDSLEIKVQGNIYDKEE